MESEHSGQEHFKGAHRRIRPDENKSSPAMKREHCVSISSESTRASSYVTLRMEGGDGRPNKKQRSGNRSGSGDDWGRDVNDLRMRERMSQANDANRGGPNIGNLNMGTALLPPELPQGLFSQGTSMPAVAGLSELDRLLLLRELSSRGPSLAPLAAQADRQAQLGLSSALLNLSGVSSSPLDRTLNYQLARELQLRALLSSQSRVPAAVAAAAAQPTQGVPLGGFPTNSIGLMLGLQNQLPSSLGLPALSSSLQGLGAAVLPRAQSLDLSSLAGFQLQQNTNAETAYVNSRNQAGLAAQSTTSELPTLLAQAEDHLKLSDHQVFLRQQIQAFEATDEDVSTHTRGRNKPIVLGQVGIRCRYCAHLPVQRRQRGSHYFPASLKGIYQTAQNMSATHMQSGVCTEMPFHVKQRFVQLMAFKGATSGAGRPYWAASAAKLGLVDTEDGIRVVRDQAPPDADTTADDEPEPEPSESKED